MNSRNKNYQKHFCYMNFLLAITLSDQIYIFKCGHKVPRQFLAKCFTDKLRRFAAQVKF